MKLKLGLETIRFSVFLSFDVPFPVFGMTTTKPICDLTLSVIFAFGCFIIAFASMVVQTCQFFTVSLYDTSYIIYHMYVQNTYDVMLC